jgi:hypothetical protein
MSGMTTMIKVKTVEGEKRVKATVRSVFAAHKMIGVKGYFAVSHIPSGLCLMSGLFTEKHASTVADMLVAIEGSDSLFARFAAEPSDIKTKAEVQNHTRGLRDRAWVIASKVG